MLTKIRIGKYRYPIEIEEKGNRLVLQFRYNPDVIAEVKTFQGARWHPEEKYWTVTNSPRNKFQLAYMQGENPYAWYDREIVPWEAYGRVCFKCGGHGCYFCKDGLIYPYNHQVDMVRHGLTYKRVLFAADPGCGKTLSTIYIMELSGEEDWRYVAPRSALASVEIEFRRWDAKVRPEFMTYEGLVKAKTWTKNLVLDEISRAKNPTAKRSQAAMIAADYARERDGYVIGMTGTPAPKAPTDWWHLCETACPGFIREGDINKFKARLALIEYKESLAGGVYPELLTWLDDENKCANCGKYRDDPIHVNYQCTYRKSKNEVLYLYERMKGLVIVKDKKTCLDLPDKIYREIEIQPTEEILNAAALIEAQSARVITTLTLHRELSDGFQYREEERGTVVCPLCKGMKIVSGAIAPNVEYVINVTECPHCLADVDGFSQYCYNCGEMVAELISKSESESELESNEMVDCPQCGAMGEVPRIIRIARQVASPKIERYKELLDEYEDVGRLVTYAGFTGSIDRIVETAKEQGWETIQVDGRGWKCSWGRVSDVEMIEEFQSKRMDRIDFIGHPQSGGMGLTLTASPAICYYSNDFNYESRAQSEDRIHRPGMDQYKGATIYDLLHLPTDRLVLDNLKKKERLQSMSLGRFKAQIQEIHKEKRKRIL